ncbi:hypothetical protein [Roseimaritima ulvae]|uniref:hypothetical protein n=1 Tax=Roseimaritima ulvae TaxID=980254 RepID=UPI00082CEF68|nr:hypothetical protein [Roseimaritima ulvae]
MKRDIPILGNVCISYSVTLNDDGSERTNTSHPFFEADCSQWAWRASLRLEGRYWCIPMTFASQRDATIAARSIAPYFSECQTREEGQAVVQARGYSWLRARLTENLRW